jgi:hypothetical protein
MISPYGFIIELIDTISGGAPLLRSVTCRPVELLRELSLLPPAPPWR